MICARCDKPILPGQASQTYPVDSASAARADITVHAEPCEIPEHQTAPRLTDSQRFEERLRASTAHIRPYHLEQLRFGEGRG